MPTKCVVERTKERQRSWKRIILLYFVSSFSKNNSIKQRINAIKCSLIKWAECCDWTMATQMHTKRGW